MVRIKSIRQPSIVKHVTMLDLIRLNRNSVLRGESAVCCQVHLERVVSHAIIRVCAC